MSIPVEDFEKVMRMGTLHGRIENWVFQTSNGGQQMKVYNPDSYTSNAVNTALRIRARKIMQYAMKDFNPQTDRDFKDYVKSQYLSVIYCLFSGALVLRSKYFQIIKSGSYTFKLRSTQEVLGVFNLSSSSYIYVTVTTLGETWIDCLYQGAVFSSIPVKIVDTLFDIAAYYDSIL